MDKKNIVRIRDSFSILDSIADIAPRIKDHLPNMVQDSATSSNKVSLLSEIASTFSDVVNGNNAYYPEKYIKDSVLSWTTPHQKPILVNHDPASKPLGRNVGAIYKPTNLMLAKIQNAKASSLDSYGSGHVRNLVNILDAEAVEMVLDGRFQTVSVGGDSDNMICSICGHDWASGCKCSHKFGDEYEMKDGSIQSAYWEAGPLHWAELSFVNIPATDYAMIVTKDIHGGDSEKELLKIYNYSEVNKNRSPVVDSLRKRYFTAYAINDSQDGIMLNERTTVDDLYRVYGKRSVVVVDTQLNSKESNLADSNVPANPEPAAAAPAVSPVVNPEAVVVTTATPTPAFVATATPVVPETTVTPAPITVPPVVVVTPEAVVKVEAPVVAPKDSSDELKIKDAEVVSLKTKVTTLEGQLKSVQDEKNQLVTQLTDFQVKIKQEKVNQLLDLKKNLNLEVLDEKERELKVKDLMERSSDSIEDQLKDLGQVVITKIKDVKASGTKPYIKDSVDPATIEDAEATIEERVDGMSVEDMAFALFHGGINPRIRQ
jgi:exosome complex RNA-binding protein Csl4